MPVSEARQLGRNCRVMWPIPPHAGVLIVAEFRITRQYTGDVFGNHQGAYYIRDGSGDTVATGDYQYSGDIFGCGRGAFIVRARGDRYVMSDCNDPEEAMQLVAGQIARR